MTSAELPLVTIVTPVYNGEAYLEECLQSVLRQTWARWELVIVNNRSTDRTLEIAETFAAGDPRIRVMTNPEFVGVIQNHNIACRQLSATSRYLKVLQADDWLYPECLAEMIALAEAHPNVGIVGSYVLHGDRLACDGLPYPSPVVPGREICRLNLLGLLYTFLAPTALLVRADIVRKRAEFYDEKHLYSDAQACYEILLESDFGFVHKILSFVRRQQESLTVSHLRRYNLIKLANLELLIRFGPTYLSPAEFASCLKRQMRRYYEALSNALLGAADRGPIWAEHSRRMAALGRPLSPVALAGGLLRAVLARVAKG